MRKYLLLILSGMALFLAACASSNTSRLMYQDHPLAGRLWDVKQNKFISQTALQHRLLQAEYLLLGERHDNLSHHQHQAWVIRHLRQAGRRVGVGFEMIDDRQGRLLARHRIESVEQLIALLEQEQNHWQYETRYKGLFAEVMAARFRIMPANLNRQRLKQITQQGESKLPAAYKTMLQQSPLTKEQIHSLQTEIKQSHCNMLGDKAAAKLMLSQRVRDAVIAHSLTKNPAPQKVLIAGAGHVRKDRGVPRYLTRHTQAKSILALGFIEVTEGVTDVNYYARRWDSKTLPFDVVWFTPAVDRQDMCAQFRAMHKAKAGPGQP